MEIVLVDLFLINYFSIIFCLLFLSLSHFHFIHDGKQLPLLLVYICDSHPKPLNYFQKGKQAYVCYHVL